MARRISEHKGTPSMFFRRCLVAAIVSLVVFAASSVPASAQSTYRCYVAGTATTSIDQCSYYITDVQNSSGRYVYLSFTNNTTGAYYHTNNPAGNQITNATITATTATYTGTMIYGKKTVSFQYYVFADAAAPAGFDVRFVAKDKRTGSVLVDRTDKLDVGATVWLTP